jgi:hypothetical protein
MTDSPEKLSKIARYAMYRVRVIIVATVTQHCELNVTCHMNIMNVARKRF